jgi:hypothetical protein
VNSGYWGNCGRNSLSSAARAARSQTTFISRPRLRQAQVERVTKKDDKATWGVEVHERKTESPVTSRNGRPVDFMGLGAGTKQGRTSIRSRGEGSTRKPLPSIVSRLFKLGRYVMSSVDWLKPRVLPVLQCGVLFRLSA